MNKFEIVSTKWERGSKELKNIILVLRNEFDGLEIKYSIKDNLKSLIKAEKFFREYDLEEVYASLLDIWNDNNEKFLKILKTKETMISILKEQ